MKRLLSREVIGISLVVLAAVALGLSWAAPSDVTLRSTSKVVYLHGALVWAAIMMLTASGALGLVALAISRQRLLLNAWALALGRTGLLFWITTLLVSIVASRMAWNAVFLSEPRYTMMFRVLAVGVIIQVLVLLVNTPLLPGPLHLVQTFVLWALLATTPSVLHPDNPVMHSVPSIQFFFGLTVLACGLAALQVARLISSLGPAASGGPHKRLAVSSGEVEPVTGRGHGGPA